jgi:hypothetical protein
MRAMSDPLGKPFSKFATSNVAPSLAHGVDCVSKEPSATLRTWLPRSFGCGLYASQLLYHFECLCGSSKVLECTVLNMSSGVDCFESIADY